MSPQHRQGDVESSSLDENPQLDEPLLLGQENAQHHAPTFAGLLFYRTLYFLSGLSASTWGRFGIIFYNRVAHLSPVKIGILQGVVPLLSFVAMPLWGVAADWWKSRKKVYLWTQFWGSVSLLSLAFVPHDFHWILIAVCAMSLFRASGVLDAHLLDYLGDAHRGLYGTVRLWTAISWGLGAIIMGWITDVCGFEWNFILYGIMAVVMFFVVAFGLPARSKTEQERYEHANNTNETDTARHPQLAVLLKALFRFPVVVWLLEVIIIGSGMAVVESFLFVYLQNEMNASTKLCGATVGVTVLFELPIFHYSKPLLKKVGHDALFVIAMACYASRVFGYTLLTESTVHWVLALEALHGITFACMWIASIDFSASAAPKEWSTTFQSILSASFSCFGNVLGAILGGWVMEKYSATSMYRGMASIVMAALVLHLILWLVVGGGHDFFLEHQRADASVRRTQTVLDDQEDQANHERAVGQEMPQDTTENDEEASSEG